MSLPDSILAIEGEDENLNWWNDMLRAKAHSGFTEYTRTALIDAELEVCCALVLAMGLSTGHGESHVELMKEVLTQFRKLRERK